MTSQTLSLTARGPLRTCYPLLLSISPLVVGALQRRCRDGPARRVQPPKRCALTGSKEIRRCCLTSPPLQVLRRSARDLVPYTHESTTRATRSFTRGAQVERLALRGPVYLLVACSLLPRPIAKYARRDEALIQTKYGWQAARAHANSISTMMQAQHGCGFYCVDPIAFGVGSTSLIWDSPSTTQNEPSIRGSVRPNRSAVIYVQRARPAVVCDNASFPLPWKRADENEYFGGDNSLIYREC